MMPGQPCCQAASSNLADAVRVAVVCPSMVPTGAGEPVALAGSASIIDTLVEVTSLRAARAEIAPILEAQGYDYFWPPAMGDDVPPWYAFFIKRAPTGSRTHHIHMMARRPVFQGHWERLLVRDHLIAHADVVADYERLKKRLGAHNIPMLRHLQYNAGQIRCVLVRFRAHLRDLEDVLLYSHYVDTSHLTEWLGGKSGRFLEPAVLAVAD